MKTEHSALARREARVLCRLEGILSSDHVLAQVAGLFPEPVARPRPVAPSRKTERSPVRLVVLAVLGLAGGVVGVLVGTAWLTAALLGAVSVVGALMARRRSGRWPSGHTRPDGGRLGPRPCG